MFAIFSLCIFISAFLLFLVQPMIANILLPMVGGSPNIWNTCSVFFQVSLLSGYLYSYIVAKKLPIKQQIIIHCCLVFSALCLINFHIQPDQININMPITSTIIILLKNIFFPFVLLSTTSPLIQHWLASSRLKESKNPYGLYVFSNIGSLLALYAYPIFFERYLTISIQEKVWDGLFVLFFCTVGTVGFYLYKTIQENKTTKQQTTQNTIKPLRIFFWILFAFIPSSLMLGVTNHLSTDIGGVPFLWILPLSLYLLSFIFTFSKYYTEEIAAQFQKLYKTSAIIAIFLFFSQAIETNGKDNIMLIGAHNLFYFIFAIYCHGILAQKKPAPEKLTLFYLCLAIGGALGGIFNTFIAPNLFLSIWEYPFIILFSLPFIISKLSETKKEIFSIIIKSLILFIIVTTFAYIHITIKHITGFFLFYIGIGIFILFIFLKKKNFLFLVLLTCILMQLLFINGTNIIFKKRNFFGTVLVTETTTTKYSTLALYHGDTLHGKQLFYKKGNEKIYSYDPDSYYGKKAAVKDFFKAFKRPSPSIAWLGLGSGAIICYLQPETKHHIFEIDKDIVDISKKYRHFRYLEKCAAKAKINIGDARIEINKEKNEKYDLIVIDVFSSHFIPVHLTTKEALEIYRSKLKKDGVILFHISSRAFNIEPIIAKIAKTLGMTFIVRYNPAFDSQYPQWGVLSLNKNTPEIEKLLSMEGWREGRTKDDTPLWTDDFHNLLSTWRQ